MYLVAIILGVLFGIIKMINPNKSYRAKTSGDTNFFFYISGNE